MFFVSIKIEECSCSLPVSTVIRLLQEPQVKGCVLSIIARSCPGWKSPQPLTLTSNSSRYFIGIFREVAAKKPRFNNFIRYIMLDPRC